MQASTNDFQKMQPLSQKLVETFDLVPLISFEDVSTCGFSHTK
jgi:hypothetical protein